MNTSISPGVTIKEIVEKHPGSDRVFGAHGLPCAGCHVSTRETIRQGAGVHHLDLDALLSPTAPCRRREKDPRPRG